MPQKKVKTSASAKAIAAKFNDLAASLNCSARLGGTKKKPQFFEFRGGYTQGYEVWFPITADEFGRMVDRHQQLVDFEG